MRTLPHRPLLERYEIKYAIPEALVPLLRSYIQPYMQFDPFALGVPRHRYRISSLYLDTPQLRLMHDTLDGVRDRFKLRVRAYDDEPDSPIYCEVKQRHGDVIVKARAPVARERLAAILRGRGSDIDLPIRERASLDQFIIRGTTSGARPVLLVRYHREAYESRFRDRVRITLDRDLEYLPVRGPQLRVNGAGWQPTRWHPNPSTVILELKFNLTYPGWVAEMIRRFQLQRRSVAKYVLSMQERIEAERREGPLAMGRAANG
ncbi:MAG: polyphosphate polymerase domain-containing protein [Planctomycetota bacterium]